MSQKQISPARRAAFDILRRVETEGAYASVLAARLPESSLSREDRALAQELVLGVLRWQLQLDYLIERYSNRPVSRLDPPVRIALRLGLYQLRHLTRIPPSAAVNESVNLVKQSRAKSASGMTNAALRNAARNLDERLEDLLSDSVSDPLRRASIELSHPAWMLDRWTAQLGRDETESLALANNHAAPVAFRPNPLRASLPEALAHLEQEGVQARPSNLTPGAFVFESGPASALARAAEAGLIYIQDEASQMVSLLLAPEPGERVLDLCAAPGSKSSHIAALTGDACSVIACDIHPHRLSTLVATCRRLGLTNVEAVAMDGTMDLPFVEGQRVDRVLVDAPCSGTGTLRRNPEIKWRLAPDDIALLVDVQSSLLARGASVVRKGGRVVYSTCSIEREENEGVVERFLEGGRFRLVAPAVQAGLITDAGYVRTFPHRHHADGFFAAVLEKL